MHGTMRGEDDYFPISKARMAVIGAIELIAILFLGIGSLCASKTHPSHGNSHHNSSEAVMPIDKDVVYGHILPFADEWTEMWKDIPDRDKEPVAPLEFWFRCVDREVRGYFFIETLKPQNHGKETYLTNSGHIRNKLKITADGKPITQFRVWNGGGDLFFTIPADAKEDHNVDIRVQGFKHFTRFPVSKCQPKPPVSAERKYVMHIHLRDFPNPKDFNPQIIDGVANHMAYHRCAMKLDKYEFVVQAEHVPVYLANEKIAHAVREGWVTMLVRNPVIPSPLVVHNSAQSNCFYQAYTQNMAILQHWQENVKMYFFDTDEFLNLAPEVTSEEYFKIVNSHTAIGFSRRMIFCRSCDEKQPESKTMSLTKSVLDLNDHALRDPKLVVDPNRVGCYIVHWAGCGDETKLAPVAKASILHFEDFYRRRWAKSRRMELGNETTFVPAPVQTICDPTGYDWKSPLPSFHPLNLNMKQ